MPFKIPQFLKLARQAADDVLSPPTQAALGERFDEAILNNHVRLARRALRAARKLGHDFTRREIAHGIGVLGMRQRAFALQISAHRGLEDMSRMLLGEGASPDDGIVNPIERLDFPLHEAAKGKLDAHKRIARLLLDCDASLGLRGRGNLTAEEAARAAGNHDTAALIAVEPDMRRERRALAIPVTHEPAASRAALASFDERYAASLAARRTFSPPAPCGETGDPAPAARAAEAPERKPRSGG